METKDEYYEVLSKWCETVLSNPKLNIQSLQKCSLLTDNAAELTGKKATEIYNKHKINHVSLASYKHTDNSTIESFWARGETMVRALQLSSPHLSKRLWNFTWMQVSLIMNSMPQKVNSDAISKSPHELAYKEPPPIAQIEQYGAGVVVHIPVEKRKTQEMPKLQPRGFYAHYLTPAENGTEAWVCHADTYWSCY